MTRAYGRNWQERSQLPSRGETLKSAVAAMSRRLAAVPHAARVVDDRSLWYSITQSILSSQIRYETAREACERLYAAGLDSPSALSILPDPGGLCARIESVLTHNVPRIRFGRLRAQQLARAFTYFYRNGISVVTALERRESELERRAFLVENIPGIGMKQGSMVLRDSAWAHNLAVIDTHITAYMCSIGLLGPNSGPPTTAARYLNYEKKFVDHAAAIGEPVARLDQAAWWIMRQIKRRGHRWI